MSSKKAQFTFSSAENECLFPRTFISYDTFYFLLLVNFLGKDRGNCFLTHISLKFFMISRSRKFAMQKDLKSHSSSTAGSYLQPNCIQNFSDKQQLSPFSHPVCLIHATTFTESQSHAAITRLSPQEAHRRTIPVKSSQLNVISCSSPPFCHLHLSLHWFRDVQSTEIMRGIMERQIAEHLANT